MDKQTVRVQPRAGKVACDGRSVPDSTSKGWSGAYGSPERAEVASTRPCGLWRSDEQARSAGCGGQPKAGRSPSTETAR